MTSSTTTPARLKLRSLNDHPNLSSAYAAYQQWSLACDQHNAMVQWKKENADDLEGLGYDDFTKLRNAELTRQGIPLGYDAPGVLQHDWRGAWVLRLKIPVHNIETFDHVATWVIQCPECDTLHVAMDRRNLHCSDACAEKATAGQKAEQAAAKQERRAERSDALASRTGICVCCGAEFNLQRTTGKVCSDRCKKKLQRKPELADKHLKDQLPDVDPNYDHMVEQLDRARSVLGSHFAAMFTGRPGPAADQVELAEKIQADYGPLVKTARAQRALHEMAGQAPALTAWLLQQPEEKVDAVFNDREEALRVLGESLRRKLREEGLLSR